MTTSEGEKGERPLFWNLLTYCIFLSPVFFVLWLLFYQNPFFLMLVNVSIVALSFLGFYTFNQKLTTAPSMNHGIGRKFNIVGCISLFLGLLPHANSFLVDVLSTNLLIPLSWRTLQSVILWYTSLRSPLQSPLQFLSPFFGVIGVFSGTLGILKKDTRLGVIILVCGVPFTYLASWWLAVYLDTRNQWYIFRIHPLVTPYFMMNWFLIGLAAFLIFTFIYRTSSNRSHGKKSTKKKLMINHG